MNIKILLTSVLLSISMICFGQGLTKEEVAKQAKFVEALRENAIGRYDKGIKILDQLYKDDRTNSEIAFELAKANAAIKDASLVEKFAEIAIKNDTENIWYRQFYADYLMEQNLPESAIDYYLQIKKIAPLDKDSYTQLADAYSAADQHKQTIATYQDLEIKLGPTNNVIFYQFETYDLIKDYPSAISQINRLVQRNPQSEEYLSIQAQSYLKNKEVDKAMVVYKTMLEVNPSNAEANLALIGQGTDVENENAYLRSLEPIIENKSIDVDRKIKELIPYINDLAKAKNTELGDALVAVGDRLIQTHPNEAKAYAAYGDILYNTGNSQAAIKQYEKTLQLDDKSFAVWQQLMYAQLETENYKSLMNTSETAIDIFPNQAIGFFFYGVALSEETKFDDAKDIIDEGMMIAGQNKGLQSVLLCSKGINLLNQKQFDKALVAIEKAEALDNNSSLVFETMGDLHQAKGDVKKAVKAWEKSQQLGNSSIKLKSKIDSNKS